MAINGVGSNNYNYGNYTQNNVNKTQSTNEVEDTAMTSDEFLKELKQEFPEMNIYTANVTENNKNNFISGSGIYNVAVSDKYMRDVASDPKKREEFKQTLRDMKEATDNGVRFQKGRNVELYASGFILDEDGGMSSWGSMRTLDPEKNTLNNAFGTQNFSNNKSLMDRLDKNREQRKLEEEQREERRLEKREVERREQKKQDEERLEEKRESKRIEEKRQLERLNNEDLLNSNVNKVVADKYVNDINFEGNISKFNAGI